MATTVTAVVPAGAGDGGGRAGTRFARPGAVVCVNAGESSRDGSWP